MPALFETARADMLSRFAAAGSDAAVAQGRFKETDAIEIWIARWLRVPLKALVRRYGCDSRRLYEVWWGERFPASRAKAEVEFRSRFPGLTDRTTYGYRRIPRASSGDDQLALFD